MDAIVINHRVQIPFSELRFRFSRSGGPGGQNVNRVSTRVELIFDVQHSTTLDSETKEILKAKLQSRLDSTGCLRIVSQESRSQWKNKQTAIEKFTAVVQKALRATKHRTPSTATKNSKEERLAKKKGRGKTKKMRKIDIVKELS